MKQYSSKDIIKFLKKNNFIIIKQRWSHISMFNSELWNMVIIPFHNKDLKIWTLLSILKQAWFTKEDLLNN